MCLVQQEEVKPLQKSKFTVDRVNACFLMICFRECQNSRGHFLAQGNEILHDLPEGLMAVVKEKRIGIGRVAVKDRVVSFEDLPDPTGKYMLVGLQVHDILKQGPFTRMHLPADLFFRQPVDHIHQRFVLVL